MTNKVLNFYIQDNMMTENKCISVSREFADLAKDNHISWSEAARVGMALLLADKGLKEYDNNLNIYRKMQLFKTKAEEALQQLSELQTKHETNI